MAKLTEPQKLWLVDLRSHPELQGRGKLKTINGRYCCLGRACVVFMRENVGLIEEINQSFGGYNFNLPTTVFNWLDFDSKLEADCITWNDSNNYSFLVIASIVEAYWKSL